MRTRIKLTESQLHRVVTESLKTILKEDVSEIIDQLHQLEDKLVQYATKIRQLYFKNERYFDSVPRFERMGLDNPPYSHGSQGELSDAFDEMQWNEWTHGNGGDFATELKNTYAYYQKLAQMCDSEGYGMGAASRGFDVTRPIGILWTLSQKCLKILKQMAQITGVQL